MKLSFTALKNFLPRYLHTLNDSPGQGDNISLHRIEDSFSSPQRLEHIGFALDSVSSVNALYEKMKSTKIAIPCPPKTFGIGTHSFSVSDPDGIEVEFTYHPPMWEKHE